MKNLFVYFKGYMRETLMGPIFKLLEAAFELSVPLVIAYLVDRIIPQRNQGGLVLMLLALAGLAVLGVLAAITAQYFSAKSAVRFTQSLTQDLFDKVMHLPKSSRSQVGGASLVARLSSDTYQIQTGINQFLRLFLRAPIIVAGAVFMAFTISPQIAFFFLGMVLILSLLVFGISKASAPRYQILRRQLDKIVALTQAQVSGLRTIRAFSQVDREKSAFSALNNDYVKDQLGAGAWSAALTPLTYLTVNVTLVLLIWQGNAAVGSGVLSQGLLVALVNYLLQILTELLKAAVLVSSLNQAYISAQRVQAVFNLADEEIEKNLPCYQASTELALSVKNLTFSYHDQGRPTLSDLDFELKTGQFMGIIGGTGAGKSALVELLTALEKPQSGSLQIFKEGVSPKNLKSWRDWVAVVPQKAQLFKGSVRENILLGHQPAAEVTDEQIWKVLKMAQADEFIREKGGLDTEVSAFGRNFSGGQRQRLTIARALLKHSPFLILDDATSALDYLTEAKILTAIQKQLTGITLIMVSQRTRSLIRADQILVLEEGSQAGLGDHNSLLEQSAVYREIYLSQQAGLGGGN